MASLRASLRLRLEFAHWRLRASHLDPCLRKALFDSSTFGRPNVSIRRFAIKTSKPQSNPKAHRARSFQPSLPSRALQKPKPTKYVPFTQSLASRSPSILLYQSPSFASFNLVCYIAAGFCFIYSVVNLRRLVFIQYKVINDRGTLNGCEKPCLRGGSRHCMGIADMICFVVISFTLFQVRLYCKCQNRSALVQRLLKNFTLPFS